MSADRPNRESLHAHADATEQRDNQQGRNQDRGRQSDERVDRFVARHARTSSRISFRR